MEGFSFHDTICIYTHNAHVRRVVEQFAIEKGMQVCYAEDEIDLIGVPYWLAVIDASLVSNGGFLEYMEMLKNEASGNLEERFVSHTSTAHFPQWLASKFQVHHQVTINFLSSFTSIAPST